jgi:hypothetical protein
MGASANEAKATLPAKSRKPLNFPKHPEGTPPEISSAKQIDVHA